MNKEEEGKRNNILLKMKNGFRSLFFRFFFQNDRIRVRYNECLHTWGMSVIIQPWSNRNK